MVVVVMIGAVGVVATVVSVIGDGVSDCRATDAADDGPDWTADDGPDPRAPDRAGDQAALVGQGNLR
jgi:hypothetical protein